MASLNVRTAFGYHAAVFGLASRLGKIVRPECDDGEHAEQDRRGAQDCLIGPLALGFDAEMSAGFLEGDFDLPTADEPGKDVARTGVKIGCQKGLRLELASGIADQEPADRYGGTPPRYHNATPLVISTMRLVWPYQRPTRRRCQQTLRSLKTAESFFKGLPLLGGLPRPLRFCGGKPNRFGVEPQAGDDADMGADGGEKFDCRERAVGDQDNRAIREPAADLQGSLAGPIEQCLGRSRFAGIEALEGASSVRKGSAMMRPAHGTRTSSMAESIAGRWL